MGSMVRIDLPELGLGCLQALISRELESSCLAADEPEDIELEGRPAYRFRVFPLPEDPQTFLWVEAFSSKGATAGGRSIRTAVIHEGRQLEAELKLVPRRPRSCAAILGANILNHKAG